ncbi:MAG: radical SAM protein [Planctomycetes bacterium]|nr:radical SAM protein [Planctomycetota bacterium]
MFAPNPGKPLYKVFATAANHYLYDTATNQVLTISEDFARYLDKGEFSPSELEELAGESHGGVLSPTSDLPLSPGPTLAEVEAALGTGCTQVILEASRDCNMRCRYCVYSGRQPGRRGRADQHMALDTACQAVDYLQAHSSQRDVVYIGFFGGEPLLNLPLLYKVTDYARKVIQGKDLVLTVTTNGTLLTPEVMDFLAANNFSTFVSLDGPREVNDANRVFAGSGRGTFDAVTARLDEFQRRHPAFCRTNVRLSMVTAPGANYARLAEWLSEKDLSSAFVTRVADDTGEYERAYRERPLTGAEKLKADFIELGCQGRLGEMKGRLKFSMHAARFYLPMWSLRNRTLPTSPRDRAIHRGVCIPGREKLFVDCDGNLFPCEKADGRSHLRLGHVSTGVDARRSHAIITAFHEFLAQDCAACWLWRLCRVCFIGPTVGNSYDRAKARRICDGHRADMAEMLQTYCTILEQNPTGLDCFLDAAKPMAERP